MAKPKFTYDPETIARQRSISNTLSNLSCIPNVIKINGVSIRPNSKNVTVDISRSFGKFDDIKFVDGKKAVKDALEKYDNVSLIIK